MTPDTLPPPSQHAAGDALGEGRPEEEGGSGDFEGVGEGSDARAAYLRPHTHTTVSFVALGVSHSTWSGSGGSRRESSTRLPDPSCRGECRRGAFSGSRAPVKYITAWFLKSSQTYFG